MAPESIAGLRNAAWLLVVGGVIGLIGACWPPYRQWSAPHEEGLRVIAAHPIGWRIIHIGFISGTWVSVVGLGSLAYAVRERPGGTLALTAALGFGVGAIAWTLNIAIRLGITPPAADALVATGSLPASYEVWRTRARILFAIFAVLAYASVAATGGLALRSGLASRTLAYLLIAWGASAGFVVGYNVPLLAYIPYIIVGVALLRS
jgi:hypothetical protein